MDPLEVAQHADSDSDSSSDVSSTGAKKVSYWTVMFNLTSAVVGVGLFALPGASKRGGYLIPVLFAAIAVAMVYESSMLLYHCQVEWNKRRDDDDIYINSFESFGFAACGSVGQGLATVFNMCFSLGICSAYIIQVGL